MRSWVRFVLSGLFTLSLSAAAWAQTGDGSIGGSVHDPSGGAIPNAAIEVSSAQQGFTRTTTSNASGDYLVPGLPPGSYNVSVTASGFQKYQVTGIVLRVAEKARADAALTVGAVNTEVTVAGTNVAPVETESSELSGVVTGKQISQTVLNGRNFTQLVTLVPGVSNQTGQDEGTVGVYGEAGEELVGFSVVVEVAARGDPYGIFVCVVQLAAVQALVVGDDERAGFIEYPVVGETPLPSPHAGAEAIEHAQLLQQSQTLVRGPESGEVQAR